MNNSSNKLMRIFNVAIDPLSIIQLNELIAQAIAHNQKSIIAHHNLHSVYLYHHDQKMRDFYEKSNYTHIDGMALVLLGNFFGLSLQREQRVTYVDWTNPLMKISAKSGWRVFYLGSRPGIAEQAATILRSRFSGLEIMTKDGYFDPCPDSHENQGILKQIQTYRPNILMVGMSMPRQEHWILDNLEQLPNCVILPCGATLDYVAGKIPTPPRWAGKIGLEWLFRLIAEPTRLWHRYLVEPWFLLKLLIIESWK